MKDHADPSLRFSISAAETIFAPEGIDLPSLLLPVRKAAKQLRPYSADEPGVF